MGKNYGKVIDCYNTGDIITTYDCHGTTGGLVGNNMGKIENCYNRGNVSNTNNEMEDGNKKEMGYSGGISGSNSHKIKNCYNIGTINGNGLVGGISGRNCTDDVSRFMVSHPSTKNCFYLNSTAPTGIGFDETGNAEVNSREESEMKKKSFAHQLDIGNFLNQWKQNNNLNDGYPHLHI